MKSRNKKSKHFSKLSITGWAIIATLLLGPLAFWGYLQLKVVYMKSIAPQRVMEDINVIQLKGKLIHQEVRDNGCSEYQQGWLGGGIICVMSGEKMYTIESTSVDGSLRQADFQLRSKGWSTGEINFHLEEYLKRFHEEPESVLWLNYYNFKEKKGIIILGFKRNSEYSGSPQMPPAAVFTRLQAQLSNNEVVYGLATYYTYRKTEKHLFLPEF